MFKEYEDFCAVLATVSGREDALQKQVREKTEKKAAAELKYQTMIEEDATGGAEHTAESLNKVKKKIGELEDEIQIDEERLAMVVEARIRKLQEVYPTVEAAWNREVRVLREELTNRFQGMLEHRAKLTLAVQGAHELYNKAEELLRLIHQVDYKSNNQHGYHVFPVSNQVPFDRFTGHNDGILPDPDELHRVFNSGWLPDWVKHYAETGEIVNHEVLKPKKAEAPAAASEPEPEPEAENTHERYTKF